MIDGKKASQELKEELKTKVKQLTTDGKIPGLATILVGHDQASQVYVNSKIKACKMLGIQSFSHNLPNEASQDEVISLIRELNKDERINGILLQLPLPDGLSAEQCLNEISTQKDVDGLTSYSLGRLFSAKSWTEIEEAKLMVPCTPLGIIYLLKKYNIELSGKKAVVVGRSNLVGKPIAMLLMAHNATVTLAHSRTKDLAKVCKEADILIAAMGKPNFIGKDFVKKGAVVVDVGINRTEKGLCGDVDFNAVKDIAEYITPVPGGVGPMTIAMLMSNTILAAS